MPAVTRVGDNNTGHDACPGTPLSGGSPNVNINGKAAGRVGDSYVPHGCDIHVPHSGVIASGSATVFINGKSAGRVGDPVSCGGTVAQGSNNVIVGNSCGLTKSECNALVAKALKDVLYDRHLSKAVNDITQQENKTILSLPDICEALYIKSEADNAFGYLYLKEMIEKWLADKEGSPYFVDWNWVHSHYPVQLVYNDLVNNALNEAAKKVLTERLQTLKDNNQLNTEFDFTKYTNQWDKWYINYRSVRSSKIYSNLTIDEISEDRILYNPLFCPSLYAALCAFNLRVLPKGRIEHLSGNRYKVTITELYTYVSDSFDFEGEQSLGYWSIKNKDFSLIPHINNYQYIENDTFVRFKKNYNIGKDFKVFSNLHKVEGYPQTSFEVELK